MNTPAAQVWPGLGRCPEGRNAGGSPDFALGLGARWVWAEWGAGSLGRSGQEGVSPRAGAGGCGRKPALTPTGGPGSYWLWPEADHAVPISWGKPGSQAQVTGAASVSALTWSHLDQAAVPGQSPNWPPGRLLGGEYPRPQAQEGHPRVPKRQPASPGSLWPGDAALGLSLRPPRDSGFQAGHLESLNAKPAQG